MVDVTRMPSGSFGYVPTPAIVAPIEFTLRRGDYHDLGGHMGHVRSLEDVLARGGEYLNPLAGLSAEPRNPWPLRMRG
jgi:hypothetical protein